MVYCKECGKQLGPNDKFCPSCGNKIESLSEETKKQSPVGSNISPQPTIASNKPVGPAIGIIVFIFTLVGLFFLFSFFGLNIFDSSEVGDCKPIEGKISCGFCAATMECQYCPTSYSCNFATPGDTCSKLTCSSGAGVVDNRTIAQKYCSLGYCLSNGHCCPSASRYYCEGKCYASSNAANSASNGRCTGNYTIYC